MAQRPSWCPDASCSPLCALLGDEGSCFGKLAQPTDHDELKGINDKRWCVRSGESTSSLMLNNEDLEFFIYQMGCAAIADGQPLKFWALETLKHRQLGKEVEA